MSELDRSVGVVVRLWRLWDSWSALVAQETTSNEIDSLLTESHDSVSVHQGVNIDHSMMNTHSRPHTHSLSAY